MIDQFILQTDHYQFFLEDLDAAVDTTSIWDVDALHAMVAVADGLIAIGTARYGGATNVIVEVRVDEPSVSFDRWEQVVQSSLVARSGTLVLSSAEGAIQTAPHIHVQPGVYQVLVLFGNLSAISDENERLGKDIYHIILWPGSIQEVVILKQRGS
jgi:hypothetical protein